MKVAILGAGRLARAFAGRLGPEAVVWSRRGTPESAARRLDAAVRSAGIVLVAVPDGAIAGVARLLAERRRSLRGVVVLHAAGAYGPELLAPAAARGAKTGVLHPLASIGPRGAGALAGASARIEGDAAAVRAARRLAKRLGLVPLRGKGPKGPRGRAAYHAAASLAANDIVALLAAARDLLVVSGVSRREAGPAVVALAAGVLENARRVGIEGALTGPVVRGDAGTLRAQRAALDAADPLAAAAHRALSLRLVDRLEHAGALHRETAAALRKALRGPRGPATV